MAAKREKLPKGIIRTPAKSLRVQIRCTGHKTEVRTFPLWSDTPHDRKMQLDEAEAWAAETRRKLRGGMYVSTREAEGKTLADALLKLEATLDPNDNNQRKEINRIRQILADPIAQRSVAGLRKTDMASYRDDLIKRGWAKNVVLARKKAVSSGAERARIRDIDNLRELREQLAGDLKPEDRRRISREYHDIQRREGIKEPARTTITNKTQLITRALDLMGQTIDGVPDVTGATMPPSTPGRDRRLKAGEYEKLLTSTTAISTLLGLAFRFAIESALRRERILEVAPCHLVDIGKGRLTIVFPKEGRRRKRTGIVPVTPAIQEILEAAAALQGRSLRDTADPSRPFFDVNGNTFDHQWRAAVIACGIEDLHFHDLRHEATSRLFEKGLTTAEVMSITGHSTTEMLDRYSHYSASIVFDKLLDGPQRLRKEIELLVEQYRAIGGRVEDLGLPHPSLLAMDAVDRRPHVAGS